MRSAGLGQDPVDFSVLGANGTAHTTSASVVRGQLQRLDDRHDETLLAAHPFVHTIVSERRSRANDYRATHEALSRAQLALPPLRAQTDEAGELTVRDMDTAMRVYGKRHAGHVAVERKLATERAELLLCSPRFAALVHAAETFTGQRFAPRLPDASRFPELRDFAGPTNDAVGVEERQATLIRRLQAHLRHIEANPGPTPEEALRIYKLQKLEQEETGSPQISPGFPRLEDVMIAHQENLEVGSYKYGFYL